MHLHLVCLAILQNHSLCAKIVDTSGKKCFCSLIKSWCDFGANLVQHFIGRYSRYRTKSHDKSTISHDICSFSRYQTVLLKLEEIISTFGRIQKMLNLGWAFFIISWRTTMIALRASYDARFASSYEMLRIAMSGFAALKVWWAIIP